MVVLKVKRGDELFEIQAESREHWDSLSSAEQNEWLDVAAADFKKQQHEAALLANTDIIGKNIQFIKPAGTVAILKAAPTEQTKKGDTVSDDKNQIETNTVTIEKAVVDFMKVATGRYEDDLDLFNMGLANFQEANPGKGINAFTDGDQGRSLHERVNKSRTTMMAGPVAALTKPLDEEFATLGDDIAKQIEEFSVKHNLDPQTSRHRLEHVSPTFKALVAKQAEIPAKKRDVVERAAAAANRWRVAEVQKRDNARQAEIKKIEDERRDKRSTPAERTLMKLAAKRAGEKNISIGAAINELASTEEGRALYEAARGERT